MNDDKLFYLMLEAFKKSNACLSSFDGYDKNTLRMIAENFIAFYDESKKKKSVGQQYHEVFFLDRWEDVSEVQKANFERVGLNLQKFIRATMEEKP